MIQKYWGKFFLNIVGILFFLPSLLNASNVLEERSWKDIFQEAKQSVVKVEVSSAAYDIYHPYRPPRFRKASGSGFFTEQEGYIVTNAHVVDCSIVSLNFSPAAIYIKHALLGEERFKASLVSFHPQRDLALLRLDDEELLRLKQALSVDTLSHLSIADSDSLQETDDLMLVGFPGGAQGFDDSAIKATLGVCSGKEFMTSFLSSVVQTTVPTNHGNSGGPYINKFGQICGICAWGDDDLNNVAYFIPSNTLMNTLPSLYEKNLVQNPFWGFDFSPLSEISKQYLAQEGDGGVYLAKIHKGSLLEQYNFLVGDVVVKVNGLDVDAYGYVQSAFEEKKLKVLDYVSRFPLGEAITITFLRQGTVCTTKIIIQEPSQFKTNYFFPAIEKLDYEAFGGMVVVPVTVNHIVKFPRALQKYTETDMFANNFVMISDALPNSPFDDTQIENFLWDNGDFIIDTVNEQPVSTMESFRAAVEAGVETGFVVFKMKSGTFFVLSIQDIVEREDGLVAQYGYRKTSLFNF